MVSDWLSRVRSACVLGISVVALALVWAWAAGPQPALAALGTGGGLWAPVALAVGQIAFTYSARWPLGGALPRLGPSWSCRLAFLLGAGLGSGLWAYQVLLQPAQPLLWPLGCALLGAFAGGLIATGLEGALWEDSYPPSPRIAREVRQLHARRLGRLPAAPRAKRVCDVALAVVALALTTPVWMLCAFAVWFEDPGPILFVKNSVGKGGVNFRQLKFRSMVRNAEEETGPIPAREADQRTLLVGRLLRKTALDELPQLLNILSGDMSFVGPRPLRTVVVRDFLRVLPQFAERAAVRPGIAGLSQVRGGYYVTPLQRLRFDRIYIAHMSLRFDLWLILEGFRVVFWLRWGQRMSKRTARRVV